MSSFNKVILLGRLGSDPDCRSTQNGKNVASFSLATSEKDKIEWHKIIAWERLADVVKNYLSKGKLVCVEGKIQSREFNSDGTKRKITEIIATNIVLCGNNESKTSENLVENLAERPSQRLTEKVLEDDDDIPF